MALNYNQSRLIKATVPAIRQDGERIATLFYSNMIRDHPKMHDYFNPVSMNRGHQPRAFTAMMLAFASNLNDIYELVPRMEKVAQKHASLTITPDLYDIVGEYLLRAFAEILGDAWTPQTREAWEKAYAVMAGMLTRREALIYRDFGSWVGWRRFVVKRRWTELSDGDGDMTSFEIRPEDGKRLPLFQPGQYISVRISVPGRNHPQLRQYYLCGTPSSSTYRFTVRRDVGRETEHFIESERTHTTSSSRHTGSPRSRRGSGSSGSSRPETPSTSLSYSSSGASTAGTSTMSMRSRPGVVSSLLIDGVREGDMLEITHPAGEFVFDPQTSDPRAPLVLISAGVGAAPLNAMLSTYLSQANNTERPISWIHGSRHGALYGEQVRELSKRYSNIKTAFFKTRLADSETLTYTMDFATDLNSGRVSAQDFCLLGNVEAEYYVCGPHKFMIEVKRYLESNYVSSSKIKFGMLSIGAMDKKD